MVSSTDDDLLSSVTCIATKSNEVEWLGAFVFAVLPLIVCLCGVVVRYLCCHFLMDNARYYVERKCSEHCERTCRTHCKVASVVRRRGVGWCFGCCWALACALVAVLGTCVWLESYGSYHAVDSTPYLWALLYAYLAALTGWLLWTYLARCYFVFSYLCLVLAALLAVAVAVLFFAAFARTVDDHAHWCSWLSLALLVPVVACCTETYGYSCHLVKLREFCNQRCTHSSSVRAAPCRDEQRRCDEQRDMMLF